ncbi:sensor histidine kinase [Conexibacter woesei]|uniref:histidine kinase n=1 Tax=Conexibacter woesei (strain DSM 14684 / CCUG 47730 / CIP 108061 / JCM 11494 / NBRC 100937 / ID131577) TaxID=469383 RepID=D3FE41_CONWI|nr:HAMP domain-containing sensor histidine kinase [Conexibacter woesei]ADB51657.1 integral membrane sensor signal transduction histidine kinase [Conexibacter woesei DSM 14684]
MSLDSSIRSAAQATYSAYRRVPTRWRLAGGSAALTFVILCGFAIIVGFLTTRQIRIQFNDSVRASADYVQQNARVGFDEQTASPDCGTLPDIANADGAKVRVYWAASFESSPFTEMCAFGGRNPRSPTFTVEGGKEQHGYRVEIRQIAVGPQFQGQAPLAGIVIYARPVSATKATVAKVRFFLVLGALGGTALALAAGLLVARRAMTPIAELTASAREIARTRDPSRHLPQPEADDEVAELARTLDGMLEALDSARTETEATLARQREFVADASHELRTPLTSVLANLELLEETLQGDQRDAAASALRSSRRMRRLVADLLLLARADAGRVVPHRPTDLSEILLDVASELEPVTGDHELSVEADGAAVVSGARDELHRLALNLIENALRHTPPGTHVHASLAHDGGDVVLTVRDDGPGIPLELRERLFERFVRGNGDGGGGSGLGLAIVRAVAVSHGGDVTVDAPTGGGARFTVRLPAAEQAARDEAPAGA